MLYLREWRKSRALTLQELARETGMNFRSLSRYETGVVDPQTKVLTKIADALAIDVVQLFNPPPALPPQEVAR